MFKMKTLKVQFFLKIAAVSLVIATVSGMFQMYLLNRQISEDIVSRTTVITESIEHGMVQTNVAKSALEHQVDLRLEMYGTILAGKLNKSYELVNEETLERMRKELNLSGITLVSKDGNEVVEVKAKDLAEVDFGLTEEEKSIRFHALLEQKVVSEGTTYSTERMFVFPLRKSVSYKGVPFSYKLAHYYEPSSNYTIRFFIKEQDIYQFTKEVGPGTWIKEVKNNHSFIKEIAVINPVSFVKADVESGHKKAVEYGTYTLPSKRDHEILRKAAAESSFESVRYIDMNKGEEIYKTFTPTADGKIVYTAIDYSSLGGPLKRHSLILIVTGLASLAALFLISAQFFNKVYDKLFIIKNQIECLENGDFTHHSHIHDRGELGALSKSINHMVNQLNSLVSNTQEQAAKTKRLAILLESEASETVEKMYDLSTEATMIAREQLYEIINFLEEIEKTLITYMNEGDEVEGVVKKIQGMKQMANFRTAATTNMTIKLSDLLKSLHRQAGDLSNISSTLQKHLSKFKL